MKKTLSILLAIILVVGLAAVPVLAAVSDNFVPSIEEKDEPELDEDPDLDDGLELVITPYSQKDTPKYGIGDITDNLDWAFNEVDNASEVADLCPALGSKAQADGVDPKDLVVAQLFDATVVDTENKVAVDPWNEPITFTLKDDLNKYDHWYVMYSPDNDNWTLIPASDLSYDSANRKLTVSVDSLCAFAVVVEDKGGHDSPQTGDNTMIYLLSAMILASLAFASVKKAVKNN